MPPKARKKQAGATAVSRKPRTRSQKVSLNQAQADQTPASQNRPATRSQHRELLPGIPAPSAAKASKPSASAPRKREKSKTTQAKPTRATSKPKAQSTKNKPLRSQPQSKRIEKAVSPASGNQERPSTTALEAPYEPIAEPVPIGSEVDIDSWSGRNSSSVTESTESTHLPDSFYLNRGYSPPRRYAMASTNASTRTADTTKRRKRKHGEQDVINPAKSDFDSALRARNISIFQSNDKMMEKFSKTLFQAVNPREPHITDEKWNKDINKCHTSNESVFQRTAMMNIFDRFNFGDDLDYNCEVFWISDREISMPARRTDVKLTLPKPDLAISFTTESLMPEGHTMDDFDVFADLESRICPEQGSDLDKLRRAFPFFIVETKGKGGEISNVVAEKQNLNSASLALHNMYLVMREAGKLSEFTENVRVFSAVATSLTFNVRVHRAEILPKERRIPKHHDYEVGYRFDNFEQISVVRGSNGDSARARVTSLVYNILFNYGVGDLAPLLKGSLQEIITKRDSMNGADPVSRPSESDPQAPVNDEEENNPKRAKTTAPETQSFQSNATTVQQGLEYVDLGD